MGTAPCVHGGLLKALRFPMAGTQEAVPIFLVFGRRFFHVVDDDQFDGTFFRI